MSYKTYLGRIRRVKNEEAVNATIRAAVGRLNCDDFDKLCVEAKKRRKELQEEAKGK